MSSLSSGHELEDYLPSPPMSPRSDSGSESSVHSGLGSFVIPNNDEEIKTLAAELAEAEMLKSKRDAGHAGAGSSRQHAQQAARSPPPPATRVRTSAPHPRMTEKARKQAENGYISDKLFNADNYGSIAGLRTVLNTIKDARTIYMLDMSMFDASAVFGSNSTDVPLNNADVEKLIIDTLETTCAETIKLGPGLLNKIDVGRALANNKCVKDLSLEISGADLVKAAFNVKNALENPRIQELTLTVPRLSVSETNSLFWTVKFPPNIVTLFLIIHGNLSLPAVFEFPSALQKLSVGVRGGYREVGQLLSLIEPLTALDRLCFAIDLNASTDGASSVVDGFTAAISNKRRLQYLCMFLNNFVGLPETDSLRAALRSLPHVMREVTLNANIESPFVKTVAGIVLPRGWHVDTANVGLLEYLGDDPVVNALEIDIKSDDVAERALSVIPPVLNSENLVSLKIIGKTPVAETERFITNDHLAHVWDRRSKLGVIHFENIPFRSSHIRSIVRSLTRNQHRDMDISLCGSIPTKEDAELFITMALDRKENPFKSLDLQKSNNTTFFDKKEKDALNKKFKSIGTTVHL